MFWTVIVPLFVYWLVFFTIHFVIVEYGQDYFYDEVTSAAGGKIALGSFISAAIATYFHPSLESMFTYQIQWTVLQAIIWFVIFTVIYQFQPQHAVGLAIVAFLIFPGLATMAVDGMSRGTPTALPSKLTEPGKPIRRSAGGGPVDGSKPPADPAKAKDEATPKEDAKPKEAAKPNVDTTPQ